MGYKYGGQDKKDKNTSMAFKIQNNIHIQDSRDSRTHSKDKTDKILVQA